MRDDNQNLNIKLPPFDDDCVAYHDALERQQLERAVTTPMGNQLVCRCGAYDWPHRMGYGMCDKSPADFDDIPSCPHCGSDDVDFFDEKVLECKPCAHRWPWSTE